MHLGIDLAPLRAHGGGIPTFARQVLGAILADRPDWSVRGFSWGGWSDPRITAPAGSGQDSLGAMRDARRRARLSGMALSLPLVASARATLRALAFRALPRPPLDLFYAINFVPPAAMDCPVLPVVHDLFHLHAPGKVHPARRRVLAPLAAVARAAPRVQCVSNHTADDVNRLFGVPAGRLDVVYPAVAAEFLTAGDGGPVDALGLERGSYWLAVGMAEPRKNLGLLLEVIERFPDVCPPERPLVLTGASAWNRDGYQAARISRLQAQRRLRHLGFVPPDVLAALYAHCTAFLMPSLHEGFGLPLVEALAAGGRVIAADNSSLPEIAGGHALLLDATDGNSWGEAMRDHARREPAPATIAAARSYAGRFSMQATGRAALASIEAV
ncbi:MAG: glycosyltransferase family 4 protein [Xanthobacteraceae bacterium]|nr:glycosyltransferase family 4 protein [Xanthobacteraceae bacterium]